MFLAKAIFKSALFSGDGVDKLVELFFFLLVFCFEYVVRCMLGKNEC